MKAVVKIRLLESLCQCESLVTEILLNPNMIRIHLHPLRTPCSRTCACSSGQWPAGPLGCTPCSGGSQPAYPGSRRAAADGGEGGWGTAFHTASVAPQHGSWFRQIDKETGGLRNKVMQTKIRRSYSYPLQSGSFSFKGTSCTVLVLLDNTDLLIKDMPCSRNVGLHPRDNFINRYLYFHSFLITESNHCKCTSLYLGINYWRPCPPLQLGSDEGWTLAIWRPRVRVLASANLIRCPFYVIQFREAKHPPHKSPWIWICCYYRNDKVLARAHEYKPGRAKWSTSLLL